MSLDVYLTIDEPEEEGDVEIQVCIRENGQRKTISLDDWYDRHPGIERRPIYAFLQQVYDDTTVYSANITHNLNKMAEEAGIYEHLWRPDELGIVTAAELIEPLSAGLELLKSDPGRFMPFNPPNGWGDYDGLVHFVAGYLRACQRWPEAKVRASR